MRVVLKILTLNIFAALILLSGMETVPVQDRLIPVNIMRFMRVKLNGPHVNVCFQAAQLS